MRHLFIVLLAALVGTSAIAEPRFYEKQYRGFTVWLECTENGAVLFRYELDQDSGSVSRSGSFKVDPSVPGLAAGFGQGRFDSGAVGLIVSYGLEQLVHQNQDNNIPVVL